MGLQKNAIIIKFNMLNIGFQCLCHLPHFLNILHIFLPNLVNAYCLSYNVPPW